MLILPAISYDIIYNHQKAYGHKTVNSMLRIVVFLWVFWIDFLHNTNF